MDICIKTKYIRHFTPIVKDEMDGVSKYPRGEKP